MASFLEAMPELMRADFDRRVLRPLRGEKVIPGLLVTPRPSPISAVSFVGARGSSRQESASWSTPCS